MIEFLEDNVEFMCSLEHLKYKRLIFQEIIYKTKEPVQFNKIYITDAGYGESYLAEGFLSEKYDVTKIIKMSYCKAEGEKHKRVNAVFVAEKVKI